MEKDRWKEVREQARRDVDDMEVRQAASRQRIVDAANQILDLSDKLHLTWMELERAYELVKRLGHIGR